MFRTSIIRNRFGRVAEGREMVEEASRDDAAEILSVINISNREAYGAIIPKEHFKEPVMSLDEVLEDFERMT